MIPKTWDDLIDGQTQHIAKLKDKLKRLEFDPCESWGNEWGKHRNSVETTPFPYLRKNDGDTHRIYYGSVEYVVLGDEQVAMRTMNNMSSEWNKWHVVDETEVLHTIMTDANNILDYFKRMKEATA